MKLTDKIKLSQFTKSHLKDFVKNKYKVNNNCSLLKYILDEKHNIISFIKRSDYKFNFNKIDLLPMKKRLKSYTNSEWVLNEQVNKYIDSNEIMYNINWGDNNIYVVCDNFEILKERLIILIYIIEYLKHKAKFNKKYEIYLILTDLVKQFPNNDEIVKVKHVNTGYTNFSNNIIFIWRFEEFEKVLLHEVIHYTNFFDHDININHDLHIKGPESYYEAVTDLWAIIYNCIYISLMTKLKLKYIFMIELGFVRNQALALYDHFDNNIIQETPAYSYYIIKYMLFNYLIINNKLPDTINDKIISESVKENILVDNKYIKLDSLRMTLFELETK